MANEAQMASAKEKLRRFLTLAEEILSLRQAAEQRLDGVLASDAIQDTMRNRVLIGLLRKALDSFERLVVDARENRAESSHHLKTMAECFIYSHWVSRDPGEQNAKLLYAKTCCSRAVYHEACSDPPALATVWMQLHREQISGIETEWSDFSKVSLEQRASQAQVGELYSQIYRLACEAAHMGDYIRPQNERGQHASTAQPQHTGQ